MNKYQEAIDILQRQFNDGSLTTKDIYGAVQIVDELVDKETPQKVIYDGSTYSDDCDKVQYICPSCKKIMVRTVCTKVNKPKYCYMCGQHLDWSK